jgi:hypothetical protein
VASEQERMAAREALAPRITAAIRDAFHAHPQPEQIMAAVPMTLAGLAGAYVQQMLAARVLGDGEGDKLLAEMVESMRAMADPSARTSIGSFDPKGAAILRRFMRGGGRG